VSLNLLGVVIMGQSPDADLLETALEVEVLEDLVDGDFM
jgi:hypothetical protein